MVLTISGSQIQSSKDGVTNPDQQEENKKLSDIMRDFKKFTSKNIVAAVKEINESRKEWLLNNFELAGRTNFKNKEYRFWQDGFHPIELDTNAMMEQKLGYLHYNPVVAGIVYEPEHYVYSSAINYTVQQGMIAVLLME